MRISIALIGNPNVGKSVVFNSLTGLKQHTGNWPGKTVSRAEGHYDHAGRTYRLIDLPGTYSLLAESADEQVARDFILFDRPDCVIVVVDATALERNLNLALQVMQITARVVLCVNLIDEAQRRGLRIDAVALSAELGVPVVLTAARSGVGLDRLIDTVAGVCDGRIVPQPHLPDPPAALVGPVESLTAMLRDVAGNRPNLRWLAYRLLEGDEQVIDALRHGGGLFAGAGRQRDDEHASDDDAAPSAAEAPPSAAAPGDNERSPKAAHAADAASLLDHAAALRRGLPGPASDCIVESLYNHAQRIAGAVMSNLRADLPNWQQRLDRVLTHPVLGMPLMLALLAAVLWLTIFFMDLPSGFLMGLLVDEGGLSGWLGHYLGLGAPAWAQSSLYQHLHALSAWLGRDGLRPVLRQVFRQAQPTAHHPQNSEKGAHNPERPERSDSGVEESFFNTRMVLKNMHR